nr:protein slowmo homolog [Ipomoea batatas]
MCSEQNTSPHRHRKPISPTFRLQPSPEHRLTSLGLFKGRFTASASSSGLFGGETIGSDLSGDLAAPDLESSASETFGSELSDDLAELPADDEAACLRGLRERWDAFVLFSISRAYSQEHTYKHPWERVTTASWRKFADPENKRVLSHIRAVDTLNHKLDSSSGKLYTTRAVTIHAPGPWFISKITGQDSCHCVESTVVDAQSRSMQISTRNISLEKFIEVEEKIRYDPHPENPNGWTICRQETSIRIKPLSALASMAEKIEQKCAERFQQNSAKGREVMERMCKYLETESSGISM